MEYIIVFIAAVVLFFVLRRRLRHNKKKRYGYSSRKLAPQASTTQQKLGVLADNGVRASLIGIPKTTEDVSVESVEEMLRKIDGAMVRVLKPLPLSLENNLWGSVEPNQVQGL